MPAEDELNSGNCGTPSPGCCLPGVEAQAPLFASATTFLYTAYLASMSRRLWLTSA